MSKFIATLAMATMIATPAFANGRDAALASSSDRPAAHSAVFAGATYRISLDRRFDQRRGRASLKLAGVSYLPGSSEIRFSDGLELTGGKTGKPAFHLAGQDIGQLNKTTELSGTGTALIVGGVIVLGVIVALVAADLHHDNKCSDGPDECG